MLDTICIMWPDLQYPKWQETLDTLHMWMQIVGKVKLTLAPFINQWWEVAFYVTSTGMTTGDIPYGDDVFQIDFDFQHHILSIYTSTGQVKEIPLTSRSVAAFYDEFMDSLKQLGIHVTIWPVPVEVANLIPFDKDTKHASYDKKYVARWWHILVKVNSVFEQFRTTFRGKSSPVHFFWGSFDLAATRFSGKKADPPHLKGVMGKIMKFAENEENFTFGFWPGDERLPYPAFYSYIYPAPPGYASINLNEGASFNERLSECILQYKYVRKVENPVKTILRFLESSYIQSAILAGWDIESLKTQVPKLHIKGFSAL